MRLYVDDDAASAILITLLRQAQHDVYVPMESGTAGLADARHFSAAIADSRALLTFNYGDFKDLHLLLQVANGAHHGLLVVRKNNDSTRDMSPRGIVNAIRKLELADAVIKNEYVILNYWR